MNDNLYVYLTESVRRKTITFTNYSKTLYNLYADHFHFNNANDFMNQNKDTITYQDGFWYSSTSIIDSGEAKKVTFDSSFNNLRNNDILFNTHLNDINSETDLTYFKTIRGISSHTNFKYHPNLRFIEGNIYHPSKKFKLESQGILQFEAHTGELKKFILKAPDTRTNSTRGIAEEFYLNTKLLAKADTNFFDTTSNNGKILIADLLSGSDIKPIKSAKDLKIFDLNGIIDWKSKGIKSENYYRVEAFYEKDGFRYALLQDRYDNSSSAKKALLYEISGEIKNNVVFPESFTYNGTTYKIYEVYNELFSRNRKIETVIFPSTVKKYGNKLFYGANKLKRVEFKSLIENIKIDMFEGCSNLEEMILAKEPTLLQLETTVTQKLRKLVMPANANYSVYGNVVLNKKNSINEVIFGLDAKNYIIPFGVFGITRNAFKYRRINKITFPATLKKIGYQAFENVIFDQEVIELPEGVEELDRWAFNISGAKGKRVLILPKSIKKIADTALGSSTVVKFRGDKPIDFNENNQGTKDIEYNYEG